MTDSDRRTPERNKLVKAWIDVYLQAMEVRTKRHLISLQEAIWAHVLDGLEPRQREAFELVCECTDMGTALVPVVDIAEALDMSEEAASINMKSLVDLGLLGRVRMTEDRRTWYEYGLPWNIEHEFEDRNRRRVITTGE